HTVRPSRHSPTFELPHVWPTRPSLVATSDASSTSPSQSLSSPSQISLPPLVGMQKYSQPSSGLPFASWNPGAQSVAGLNVHWPFVHLGDGTLGNTHWWPHVPQLSGVLFWKPLSTMPSQSLSR